MILTIVSPWMTAQESADYLPGNRSPRFVHREAKAGPGCAMP